jgi:uncharacterized protein (TIGR03067 family)
MRLLALLAAGVLAGAATAAPVPKAKGKRPDAEVLVGRWEAVVAEVNGAERPKATWTFDEQLKMKSEYPDEGGRFTTWAVKIDPEKTPKEIDIEGFKGIYEFDGEDLRVAYSAGDRPSGFDPKPGVNYNLFRRVDPKKDK